MEFGTDLQTEHERYLCEEHFKKPVIVYDYPKAIKAFYMRLNDDDETVAAMDLLVPRVGELVGGSQREERLDVLERRMAKWALEENYWWYLDIRRFGTVPHAGIWTGIRTFSDDGDRRDQYPRRHCLSPDAQTCRVLRPNDP